MFGDQSKSRNLIQMAKCHQNDAMFCIRFQQSLPQIDKYNDINQIE